MQSIRLYWLLARRMLLMLIGYRINSSALYKISQANSSQFVYFLGLGRQRLNFLSEMYE